MMSHRILTAVTLAAVSIHAVLGCCWHHAHQTDFHSPESTVALIAGCQGHHHASQSEPADDHDHHGHPESCDGVECVFYSADNSDFDLSVAAVFFLPPTKQVCFAGVLESVRRIRGTEHPNGGLQLPEPLHALKQVWLI